MSLPNCPFTLSVAPARTEPDKFKNYNPPPVELHIDSSDDRTVLVVRKAIRLDTGEELSHNDPLVRAAIEEYLRYLNTP